MNSGNDIMSKAQTTLELATTYSWAMIIILVVITALVFYTRNGNIEEPAAECRLGPQFICEKAILDEYGQFDVRFINNINEKVVIEEVMFSDFIADCPALPITVKQGGRGKIQCNIEEPFKKDDSETLNFDLVFNINEDSENFVTKGKISTKIVSGINDFVIDCDADGDGKDKFGCGDSSDCDDNDPDVWLSACRNNDDCSLGYICQNPGSCEAVCEQNICDRDTDGYESYSACGGDDCDDNNPNKWKAECYFDINCPQGYICQNPGVCSGGCVINPRSDQGGGGFTVG